MLSRRGFIKSMLALAASRAVPIERTALIAGLRTGLLVPIGTMFYMVDKAGATVVVMKTDSGFTECHGGELHRKHFPLLFALIGTIYGAGDGQHTFNLPDLRSRAS